MFDNPSTACLQIAGIHPHPRYCVRDHPRRKARHWHRIALTQATCST